MAPLHRHYMVESGNETWRGYDVRPISMPEHVSFRVEYGGFLRHGRGKQEGGDCASKVPELDHAIVPSICFRYGVTFGTQRTLLS